MATALSFLRAEGHNIVNERGERILLRGVGLGNWLLPEGYMWKFPKPCDRPRTIEQLIADLIGEQEAAAFWEAFRDRYITEADVQRMAELGFNSLRVPINARQVMHEEGPHAGEIIADGFTPIDRVITWCRKHGLYAFLDLHGAPGGQTGSNIDDSIRDRAELFETRFWQERTIALWRFMAQRYPNDPVVGGYDLLNEPLPLGTEPLWPTLVPLYKEIIAAIREVDTKHMIILEGPKWSQVFDVFTEKLDVNLCISPHLYCWFTPHIDRALIQEWIDLRERLNVPLWVGETGEHNNRVYATSIQLFEDANIGWSFWPWKKLDTNNTPYSITPPQGWDRLLDHAAGKSTLSRADAKHILAAYLDQCTLERCVYQPEVITAIFRRVPGTLAVEGFSHRGAGESYHAIGAPPATSLRRRDPVTIEVLTELAPDKYNEGEACVVLQPGEWIVIDAHVLAACTVRPKLDAWGETGTAIELAINGSTHETITVEPSRALSPGARQVKLAAGTHTVRLTARGGTARIVRITLN